MRDVHTIDAVRAPAGRCDGALAAVRPDDRGARPSGLRDRSLTPFDRSLRR
ncbi:hypothetical protein ACIRG4_00555 [Streptomyces sp. NPDC102395]|uniref:hypothetical protein n=1 Tax=Streptomyces sp. NPDC102395 TaxID=3366168 RepID=UPI003818B600